MLGELSDYAQEHGDAMREGDARANAGYLQLHRLLHGAQGTMLAPVTSEAQRLHDALNSQQGRNAMDHSRLPGERSSPNHV